MHSEEEVTMHIIHTLGTGKKQQSTYLIAILIFSFFKLNSRLLFLTLSLPSSFPSRDLSFCLLVWLSQRCTCHSINYMRSLVEMGEKISYFHWKCSTTNRSPNQHFLYTTFFPLTHIKTSLQNLCCFFYAFIQKFTLIRLTF